MCDYDDFEKLSDIYLDYLNSIESFLEEYFPQIKLMDFIVLDNREWENNWSYQDIRQKVMGVISVLKMRKPASIAKELQTQNCKRLWLQSNKEVTGVLLETQNQHGFGQMS